MALKSVFFEPVRNGAKKTEFRDFTDYWCNKLLDVESYHMSTDDIINGLLDGTLEIKPRGWTHILFHESGHNRTVLVEMGEIRTYPGHRAFCIDLGDVIEDNGRKVERKDK